MSNEMCASPSALQPLPPSYADSFLLPSGDLDEVTLSKKVFGLGVTIGPLMRLGQKWTREERVRRCRLRQMAEENPSITEELILQESRKDRAIKDLETKIAALKKVFTDLNEELQRVHKVAPLGVDKVGVTNRHFEESGQVLAA